MKDIEQYGSLKDDEWELLPWLTSPRPPFNIWVKPEDSAPFFFVQHHPFSLSLLLRIGDNFKINIFNKLGLEGSSKDWEILTKAMIKEWEENNSGTDMFHFDSDKDIFCVFSPYIDDIMLLAKMLRAACNDEKSMRNYLDMGFLETK